MEVSKKKDEYVTFKRPHGRYRKISLELRDPTPENDTPTEEENEIIIDSKYENT